MNKQEVQERLAATVRPILLWYQEHARELPWRRDREPYHVWLSEIMLQQTRVEAVIPYYERFLSVYPDLASLAEGDDETLMKLWEGLGYYSRMRNLKKAAQALHEAYGGHFPETAEGLQKLPGIGAYTAGAIASIAFGQPVAAVDGNVLRVFTRVLADDRDIADMAFRRELAESLTAVYPSGTAAGAMTQGIMDLGATVCLPNAAPVCRNCPLAAAHLCQAHERGEEEQFPVKRTKKERRKEVLTVLILRTEENGVEDQEDAAGYILSRRPEKGLLGGLFEFPNVNGRIPVQELPHLVESMGLTLLPDTEIEEEEAVRHIFTHVEWEMWPVRIRVARPEKELPEGRFAVTEKELREKVALPTAFRKLL